VLARFIATAKCVRARLQSCRKSKKDAGLQPLFFHLLAIAQRLERFQDRYTLSALLRGRRSLGSRRLECIPFGYGNPETAIKPGSKLVICGTTEQAAEKGMVSG
jgi:hypothetical protein